MANAYQVFPDGDDWGWRLVDEDGKTVEEGTGMPRGEAITAAREHRGDTMEELFRADGSPAGQAIQNRGPESLVLLRPDGSVYGELDHEVREGGTPQEVTLEPATDSEGPVDE